MIKRIGKILKKKEEVKSNQQGTEKAYFQALDILCTRHSQEKVDLQRQIKQKEDDINFLKKELSFYKTVINQSLHSARSHIRRVDELSHEVLQSNTQRHYLQSFLEHKGYSYQDLKRFLDTHYNGRNTYPHDDMM